MKMIDMKNWSRKIHFDYFRGLDYPHFNLCANVDITDFYQQLKKEQIPFFIGILYAAVRAAHEVKEFRYRIRDDQVVEHEIVHPNFTLMTEEGVFTFCNTIYHPEFSIFRTNAEKSMAGNLTDINLSDEPGKDDLLFITSIPWVSFTSMTHPIHMSPVDSVPRLSWGKYFWEGARLKLPFSVQVHHALVDGSHVGHYFQRLQSFLDSPQL